MAMAIALALVCNRDHQPFFGDLRGLLLSAGLLSAGLLSAGLLSAGPLSAGPLSAGPLSAGIFFVGLFFAAENLQPIHLLASEQFAEQPFPLFGKETHRFFFAEKAQYQIVVGLSGVGVHVADHRYAGVGAG